MLGNSIFLSIANSCSRIAWLVYAKELRVIIIVGKKSGESPDFGA
jgi:hypothetical protein